MKQCYSILLPFKHIIDYFIRLVLKVYDVLLTLASKILFISKYSEPYFNKDFIHEIKNVETLIKNLNKLKRDWHCSKSGYFMQVP
jgi:hypothetical protein